MEKQFRYIIGEIINKCVKEDTDVSWLKETNRDTYYYALGRKMASKEIHSFILESLGKNVLNLTAPTEEEIEEMKSLWEKSTHQGEKE